MGKQRLSTIEERMLGNRMSRLGFSGEDISTTLSAVRANPDLISQFASALDQQQQGKLTQYSDVSTASERIPISWAQEFGAGMVNSGISFGAGVRQILAGTNEESLRQIRKWQDANEVQLTKATNRALSEEDFNSTKFWFNTGSAIGSAASSYGTAAIAALTGVGIPASLALAAVSSYPQVYNSLLNSALDAGYSADEAVKYAHLTALPISAIEVIPAAKFGKMLGGKTVANIASNSSTRLLPKFLATEPAQRLATDVLQQVASKGGAELNKDLLAGVYRSTRNGITDRLLVTGGKVVEQGLVEGGEEVIQNYMEKFAQIQQDASTDGKGNFGTTYNDLTSRKQLFEALQDGFYGFIAGGGMTMVNVAKPIYEQGVYNTLSKFDSRGNLEGGVQNILSKINEKVESGQVTQDVADNAISVVNDVYATYKKLGKDVTDPIVRWNLFSAIQYKNNFTKEIADLNAQKEALLGRIEAGEFEESLGQTNIERLDTLIRKKDEQYQFTSEWLKTAANNYFQNRTNANRAKGANMDANIDNYANSVKQELENTTTFWDRAFDKPQSVKGVNKAELTNGLQAIEQKYNDELGIISYDAVKDGKVSMDFDVFESATKTLKNEDGSYTTTKFVHDGNGNFAREVADEQGNVVGYSVIPNTEMYNKRLTDIFSANTKFDVIAEKLANNEVLSIAEQEIYDDFGDDIDTLYDNKRTSYRQVVDLGIRKQLRLLNEGETAENLPLSENQKQIVKDTVASVSLLEKDYNKIMGNKKDSDEIKAIKVTRLFSQYSNLSDYAESLLPILEENRKNKTSFTPLSDEVIIEEEIDPDLTPNIGIPTESGVEQSVDEAIERIDSQQEDITNLQNEQSVELSSEVLGDTEAQTNGADSIGENEQQLSQDIRQLTTDAEKSVAEQENVAKKRRRGNRQSDATFAETTGVIEQVYNKIEQLYEQQSGNEGSSTELANTEQNESELTTSTPNKRIKLDKVQKEVLKTLLLDISVASYVQELLPSLSTLSVSDNKAIYNAIISDLNSQTVIVNNFDTIREKSLGKTQLNLSQQNKDNTGNANSSYKAGFIKLNTVNRAVRAADGEEVTFLLISVVDDKVTLEEKPYLVSEENDVDEEIEAVTMTITPDEFRQRYNEDKYKNFNERTYAEDTVENVAKNNGEPFYENGELKNTTVYIVDPAFNERNKIAPNSLLRVKVTKIDGDTYTITSQKWASPKYIKRGDFYIKADLDTDKLLPVNQRKFFYNGNKPMIYQLGVQEAQNIRSFVASVSKVFNIDIAVLDDEQWESQGLDSEANGYFDHDNQRILLHESRANQGTVIHELGHVITTIIQQQVPALYQRAESLVKGTEYEELVRELYPDIREEHVLFEALAWAIQKKGELLITNNDPSLYQRFRDLLDRLFKRIKELFGVKKDIDLQNLTLQQFTDEVARKILSGSELNYIFSNRVSNSLEDGTGMHAQILDGNRYVRDAAETSRQLYTPTQVSNLSKIYNGLKGKPYTQIKSFFENELLLLYNDPYWSNVIKRKSAALFNRMTPANIDALANELSRGRLMTNAEFESDLRRLWDYAVKKRRAVTDADKALVDSEFNDLLQQELADRRDYVKLYNDVPDIIELYMDTIKSNHVSVVENNNVSSAYVNGNDLHTQVSNNIDLALGGKKNKVQKLLMRTISNPFFNKFFNFSTVSNMLGGDTGLLRGIYGFQIRQNLKAANWAKYANVDRNILAQELDRLKALKGGVSDILTQKFDFEFLDNTNGIAQVNTKQFDLQTLLKLYQQYYTQTNYGRHKKGITDYQKYSDVYYDGGEYDATIVKDNGATLRRGIDFETDGQVYTVLLNDQQINNLKQMFDIGGEYNDVFELFRQFYNKEGRFAGINETYVNLNGTDLEELKGSILLNLSPEERFLAESGYYFPTKSNTVNQLGDRVVGRNVEDIRYIKQRSQLYGALEGGNGDILYDVDKYIDESTRYIRNAEVRQSLKVFIDKIEPNINPNDEVLKTKINWIKNYINDLDSYEVRARESSLNKEFLGIPYVTYNTLMSNFASSVFAFNLGNPLKQATGQLAAIGTGIIEDKYLIASQKYFTPALFGSYKSLIAPEGKIFGTIDGGKYFNFEESDKWTQEIFNNDYASDMYMRIIDLDANTSSVGIQEHIEALRGRNYSERTKVMFDLFSKAKKTFNKYGLGAMQRSDRAVIISFYVAAKMQVQDEINSGQLTDENGQTVTDVDSDVAKRRIGQLATQVTYATNNMYMINDKTELQRDISLISRAIGLFSAQPQKIANLFMQSLFDAARKDFGDTYLNNQLEISLQYAIFLGAAANAGITILYGLLKHGYDEEEDYGETALYEITRNIVGIYPSFPTELLTAAMSAIDNKQWTSGIAENAVFSNMDKMITAMGSYNDSLNEELSDYTRNKAFNSSLYGGIDGLSKVLGFPAVFGSTLYDQLKIQPQE